MIYFLFLFLYLSPVTNDGIFHHYNIQLCKQYILDDIFSFHIIKDQKFKTKNLLINSPSEIGDFVNLNPDVCG